MFSRSEHTNLIISTALNVSIVDNNSTKNVLSNKNNSIAKMTFISKFRTYDLFAEKKREQIMISLDGLVTSAPVAEKE